MLDTFKTKEEDDEKFQEGQVILDEHKDMVFDFVDRLDYLHDGRRKG